MGTYVTLPGGGGGGGGAENLDDLTDVDTVSDPPDDGDFLVYDTGTGKWAPATLTVPGSAVTVDASGFNGNLTTSDDTLQEVAQKLDDLVVGGSETLAASIIDAKGDLIVGTAADTPARVAVGSTNGYPLRTDSAATAGVSWATSDAWPSGYLPAVNSYIGPPSAYPNAWVTKAVNSYFIQFCPIWVPKDCTIDAIVVNQTVASGSAGTGELAYTVTPVGTLQGTLSTPVTFNPAATAGLRVCTLPSPVAVVKGLYFATLKLVGESVTGTFSALTGVACLPINPGMYADQYAIGFSQSAQVDQTSTTPASASSITPSWGNSTKDSVFISFRRSA